MAAIKPQGFRAGNLMSGFIAALVLFAASIYLILWAMTAQARPLATEVGGVIAQDTWWTKAGSPYVVTSSISVTNSAALRIDFGVVVKFAPGTKLLVEPRSSLYAIGSPEDPVVFTSLRDDGYGGDTNGDGQATKAAPGDWSGLEGRAQSTYCYYYDYYETPYLYDCAYLRLEHVIVRYAGAEGSSAVYSTDVLVLMHSVVEQSAGHGITIQGPASRYSSDSIANIRHSIVRNNGGHGVVVTGEVFPLLIEENTFTGNQQSALHLSDLGNYYDDYASRQVARPAGEPLSTPIALQSADVAAATPIATPIAPRAIDAPVETITPTTTFNPTPLPTPLPYTLRVAGNQITVQSAGSSARGLLIDNVSNELVVAGNLFNRVAASSAFAAIETINATSVFTGNRTTGFPVALLIKDIDPAYLPTFLTNDFTNTLSGASVAIGGVLKSSTWSTVGGYNPILYGDVVLQEGTIFTIPAGSVVKFYSKSSLNAEVGAQLKAVGTEAQPIIFTSYSDSAYTSRNERSAQAIEAQPGDWGCLAGHGAGSNLQLQHIRVRFGGGDGVGSICASGNLTLSDSIVEESGSNALFIASPSGNVSIERNTIRNNANHGIEINRQPLALSILNNTLRNNYAGLYLRTINNAAVSNNSIRVIGSNSSLRGIVLENTTSGVLISNNTLEQQADGNGYAAIETRNATAQLTSNTVSGFSVPVLIAGGYPQLMPSYSANTFSNNRYGARIAVSGLIKPGNWINGGGYQHMISGYTTLENGATLTVPAGSVVKFDLNASLNLGAGSQLSAIGSAGSPIVFTSILDGQYGGALTNTATPPRPGDWGFIWGRGNNSSLNLRHVRLRYSRDAAIGANGNLSLLDSTVEHSLGDGIYVAPNPGTSPTVTISRVTLHNIGSHAIRVEGQPGALTISDNVISADGVLAAQDAEISPAEVDNTLSSGIFLRNLATAQITGNQIEVSKAGDAARGILLENLSATVHLLNNTVNRLNESNAFAGIESRNGAPRLAGNHVGNFNIGLLISSGYPKQMPALENNDFSKNHFRNSLGVSGLLTEGAWRQDGVDTTVIYGVATLQAEAKLTIPAGSIIKLTQASALELGQGAQLFATGTMTQPVVFTSILDDEYGGDTNGDLNKSVPQPGNWNHIGSQSASSRIELRHTMLRFGGGGGSGALITQGALLLNDSTVEWSKQSGIYLNPQASPLPPVTIERSYISNNQVHGIDIGKAPNPITIKGNGFLNNKQRSINNQDASVEIDSTGNWWGDASGPADTGNPTGEGDKVSPGIDYSSWLTSTPLFVPITAEQSAPPPSVGVTSPDSFEPDDSCGQAGALDPDGTRQDRLFHAHGDVDWVRFLAKAGVTYRVEVQTPAGSIADVNLEIHTICDSVPVETWQATFTPGVRLDFKAPTNGPIYLKLANHRPDFYGATATYTLSVREFKPTTDKGALIIVAGRLTMADRLQKNIHYVTNNVYQLFKDNGYSDDKIQYLATDSTLPGYDAPATLANLQQAITSWAASRVGTDRPLTIYLMDHGGIDVFYMDDPNGQRLRPAELNQWLNQLEAAVPGLRINVIIEACHSGSFIGNAQRLSKPGRMIISSTNVENVAFASINGAQFSDRFLTSLREGYSPVNSFWEAQRTVRRLHTLQEPWIDTNGNGIPNEPEDGSDPLPNNPGVDQLPADTWAPYIVTARAPSAIVDGKGLIQAEVRDNQGVKRVWATVYAPSYVAPTSGDELVAEDVTLLEFNAQGNHQFSTEFTQFHESGTYRVVLYAEDVSGLKARLYVLEVFTASQIYMPTIMR